MNFEKSKGSRLHRYFFGVYVPNDSRSWWCDNQWMTVEEAVKTGKAFSSFYMCKTLKAFKRHLRKHGIKGVKYILTSEYEGYNVIAYGRNKFER